MVAIFGLGTVLSVVLVILIILALLAVITRGRIIP